MLSAGKAIPELVSPTILSLNVSLDQVLMIECLCSCSTIIGWAML